MPGMVRLFLALAVCLRKLCLVDDPAIIPVSGFGSGSRKGMELLSCMLDKSAEDNSSNVTFWLLGNGRCCGFSLSVMVPHNHTDRSRLL